MWRQCRYCERAAFRSRSTRSRNDERDHLAIHLFFLKVVPRKWSDRAMAETENAAAKHHHSCELHRKLQADPPSEKNRTEAAASFCLQNMNGTMETFSRITQKSVVHFQSSLHQSGSFPKSVRRWQFLTGEYMIACFIIKPQRDVL